MRYTHKNRPKFTQELMQYHFRYEPETGKLYWRNPRSNRVKAGDEAGYLQTKGYLRVSLYDLSVPVHHVIWLYVYGTWPEHQIDHIDGDKKDNRLEKLRDVTNVVNSENAKRRKDNKSGYSGITVHSGFTKPFFVRRGFNGIRHYGGSYATLEEALVALDELTTKLNALGADFTERHGK